MTSQTDLYQNFLERMDRWIASNKHKAVELFKRFDINGDGVLTYDEFKSGWRKEIVARDPTCFTERVPSVTLVNISINKSIRLKRLLTTSKQE